MYELVVFMNMFIGYTCRNVPSIESIVILVIEHAPSLLDMSVIYNDKKKRNEKTRNITCFHIN